MDNAKLVTLIETDMNRRGQGVEGDPIRVVRQWFDLYGSLVVEFDPEVPRVIEAAEVVDALDWVLKASIAGNPLSVKEISLAQGALERYHEKLVGIEASK